MTYSGANILDIKLNPGLFNDTPEDSWTLPASWYYDPAVFEAEKEAIFFRNWIYQCHISEVSKPGDYYVGGVLDQSVVIMRDNEGNLNAFYNVCSHRAHPLLKGQGNTRLIVCPYHQWCYQRNGKFQGARGRDALENWIPDNADLKPVRIENYGGFLFINLDPDAKSLKEQASVFLKDMYEACPRLDDLVLAERYELDVPANWKTIIDNNHECYHCKVNHKSLMELVDYDNKAVWSDDGISFSHKVERGDLDNSAYSLMSNKIEQDALFGFIWPTLIPLMYPGSPSLAMFQIIPTGPETARERWDFYLLDKEPTEQERQFINYIKNVLIPEDINLCIEVQKGLHSKGYNQGKFVVDRCHPEFSEHHVHFFQKFVRNALVK